MPEEISNLCIDRVLPQEMFRPQPTMPEEPGQVLRAVFEFRKMWVNGSTLRIRFLNGTPAQQAQVQAEALVWTEHANLKFDFTGAPDAEIRVEFANDRRAWSNMGTDALHVSRSKATLHLGFEQPGTIAHEFGHAIGLGHEHQNPAGGILWNEAVVISELSGPPNDWTEEETRHNVLDKYSRDQIRGTSFDGDSIMLYSFPGRWTQSGQETKENEVLSALDKSFIGSREAYPRTAAPPVEIAVNATKPTDAKIGMPGEEDLFTFTVTRPGRHTISTKGKTNVMMKLFGPDSQTRLIAEDDDSGVSTNAKLSLGLIPGRYFVQIRHFNQATGTGDYSVQVRR